jgi:hypothetical protein
MFYAIQFDTDWIRTADNVIALWPSESEALEAVAALGGTVVPMKVV